MHIVARRGASIALAGVMLVGGAAAPALADQVGRTTQPSISALQDAQADLSAAVAQARAAYASALSAAKAARSAALAGPRAARAAELADASTAAERRAARRAYARAIAPILADYRNAKRVAVTTRDAAIEEALATYLAETATPPELAAALATYREATAKARATLALALQSARTTFQTDTSDERQQLLADLEQADDDLQRGVAWQDFLAASRAERAAQAAAIAGARSTYFSAMRQARAVFRAQTGMSVRTVQRDAFGR
ncbi:MAG TPA: hypothetical protein VF143_11565 [Candidatus Nanopelagicales bacterium]